MTKTDQTEQLKVAKKLYAVLRRQSGQYDPTIRKGDRMEETLAILSRYASLCEKRGAVRALGSLCDISTSGDWRVNAQKKIEQLEREIMSLTSDKPSKPEEKWVCDECGESHDYTGWNGKTRHKEAAPSTCCRQSLSCGGPMLMIADGGKNICADCVKKMQMPTDDQVRKWIDESLPAQSAPSKDDEAVGCALVVWTPALLADACEKLAEDKELIREQANWADVNDGVIKDHFKNAAKLLRERGKANE